MQHEHECFRLEAKVADTVPDSETLAHNRNNVFPFQKEVLFEYPSVTNYSFDLDGLDVPGTVDRSADILGRSVGYRPVKSEIFAVNRTWGTNMPQAAGSKEPNEETVQEVKTLSPEILRSHDTAL